MYGSQKINCTFCEKDHKMKRTYFKCLSECPAQLNIKLIIAKILIVEIFIHILNDFFVQDANTLIYQGKYYINLFPRYCSCPCFIDIGTCKYHVAACSVMKHVDPDDREFLTIVGRGRPKNTAK